MISIKPLKKPELENIKMNCDKIIHKKLTEFPMINDVWCTTFRSLMAKSQVSRKVGRLQL